MFRQRTILKTKKEKKMGKTSEYLEITAAKDGGDGKHKVAGLAYSGGKMRLF